MPRQKNRKRRQIKRKIKKVVDITIMSHYDTYVGITFAYKGEKTCKAQFKQERIMIQLS
jgi:hypothetical protein